MAHIPVNPMYHAMCSTAQPYHTANSNVYLSIPLHTVRHVQAQGSPAVAHGKTVSVPEPRYYAIDATVYRYIQYDTC